MEPLRHLLQQILRELPTLWKRTPGEAGKYISHTWHAPSVELKSLLPRIPLKIIGFWHSPKNKQDILALLPLKFFGNARCFSQMEQLLTENPQLTFFGGQYFSPFTSFPSHEWAGFGPHHYFLPAVCLESNPEKTTATLSWTRETARNSARQADFIFHIQQVLNPPPPLSCKLISEKNPSLICPQDKWSETVDSALKHIQSGKLEKVVLARKQIINLKGRVVPRSIFDRISRNTSGENYEFYLQISPDTAFISMTPEKLFELSANKLKTESLAGTRPRGENPKEDKRLESELLDSPKERHEQALVTSFIKDKLEQLSTDVTCHPLQVLKLRHIQHIRTPIEGTVPSSSNSVEKIVSLLHPTPAVAGSPTEEALNFLREKEVFQRGLYAAPIGIIQKDYAHFAVAIRSSLIYHNKLHVYAGAGIVKNSLGIEEWKETQNKMMTYQELF